MKIILTIVIATLLSSCTSAPVYRGPKSDHFNGKVFVNRLPADKGFLDILKLSVSYGFKKSSWPKWVDPSAADPITQTNTKGIAATIINHSTVLIQVDGINILTDPVFSRRASPFGFVGPKRVTPPAIEIESLPPIDVILISHNHYDHLDIESLRKLYKHTNHSNPPRILAGLGNSGLFKKHKLHNHADMDWGQSESLGGVQFEFVESRHRSGRGITDQMKTLWGGFVIGTSAGNIYFGGDTGYGPHFADAQRKFGDFTLALIPIGAYEPRWFMEPVHLDPEQAVLAHRDLGSQLSLAIHHSTFQLTYEGIDAPQKALQLAMTKHKVSEEKFIAPAFGKTITVGANTTL
jgi:L-ascorbate metabolism protein UlaG (beta-lactamase superfamily)